MIIVITKNERKELEIGTEVVPLRFSTQIFYIPEQLPTPVWLYFLDAIHHIIHSDFSKVVGIEAHISKMSHAEEVIGADMVIFGEGRDNPRRNCASAGFVVRISLLFDI